MNKKSYTNSKPEVAIVGSGVVGKATGIGLVQKGFTVTFIDTSKTVVDDLCREGYNAFPPELVNPAQIDIFLVSVPSYTTDEENGLFYIKEAAKLLGTWIKNKKDYSLVALRSTLLPGSTEDIIVPIIEKYSGKRAWNDFGVCVNPEYLREKSAQDDFIKPWIVVIGEKQAGDGDILQKLYSWVECPVHRLSIKEAEIQKFIHNVYNASKISFFNEMRMLCNNLGLNGDAVFPLVVKSTEASWNPDYGIKNLGAFDGACLPKDTRALSKYAAENLSIDLIMVKAIIEVNNLVKVNNLV